MQYEFFARSLEVLTEVKANWGTPMPHSTPSLTNARSNTVRRPPNGLSRTSSNNSAEDSGNTAMNLLRSAAPRKLSVGRNPSTESSSLNLASTMRQVPSRNNSTFSDRDDFSVPNSRTAPPPAPPVLPRRLCKLLALCCNTSVELISYKRSTRYPRSTNEKPKKGSL